MWESSDSRGWPDRDAADGAGAPQLIAPCPLPATALRLLAAFESSSLMLAACGAVAVAVAAGGMFVRHERGFLPSTALVAGALITIVGILGFDGLIRDAADGAGAPQLIVRCPLPAAR